MAIHHTLTIQNKKGLHARAAAVFVKEADKFKAEIWVQKDGQKVSGRSILGLMMLAAAKGSFIEVICHGKDEKKAVAALESLINDKFHEKN